MSMEGSQGQTQRMPREQRMELCQVLTAHGWHTLSAVAAVTCVEAMGPGSYTLLCSSSVPGVVVGVQYEWGGVDEKPMLRVVNNN